MTRSPVGSPKALLILLVASDLVGHRAARPLHLVPRSGAGPDRRADPGLPRPRLRFTRCLHSPLDPRGHPDGRREVHLRRGAASASGSRTPSASPATTTTASATSPRASSPRSWPARSSSARRRCAAAAGCLPRGLLLPGVQRVLRADRVVDRAVDGRGRGGVPRHPGRRVGHAVGHADGADRRDR